MMEARYDGGSLCSHCSLRRLKDVIERPVRVLAGAALLLASLLFVPNARAQDTLTVMTWNIKAQGASGTWGQWGGQIIDYLLASDAQIIALAEAGDGVADMMADIELSTRFDFFETASDQPILIDKSLALTVSARSSGIGSCSPGSFATIERPGGALFDLYNNHFCFASGQNLLDAEDLVSVADPTTSDRMVVALGDLNTNLGFNPATLSYLLSSGWIDTWEHTNNPDPKPDVMWILINDALVDGAWVTNAIVDDSCGGGSCSDHRAFFVDIEFGLVFADGLEDGTTDAWTMTVP